MPPRAQLIQYCFLALLVLLPVLPRLFVHYTSTTPQASTYAELAKQKRAYATFFSNPLDASDDSYFTAVRVLVYQILHDPDTRTTLDIPLLVLVSPDVPENQRHILATEGATVIPVEPIRAPKSVLHSVFPQWTDQLSKIRLFEMTDYDRILYMSSDMLLTKTLDRIWDEPVSQRIQHTRRNTSAVMMDESNLPSTYLFAGIYDKTDALPATGSSSLNPDFWLLRPDTVLFEYYRSVIDIADRFDSTFMDQGLLSYVHRSYGNMPPAIFPSHKWTTNWPKPQDFDGRCATLHDKFWHADNASRINRRLAELWWTVQSRMEAFWKGWKA